MVRKSGDQKKVKKKRSQQDWKVTSADYGSNARDLKPSKGYIKGGK